MVCKKQKDAADVLCDTNENDGVAKWIKKTFYLINSEVQTNDRKGD